ncbi:MAG: adenylosuccinate synthase [Mariprofundales bacterium]|nr:adenylosuccinate synthase [Mariprofundales bacterium]
MSNIIAIGIQWGDEGKGKIVDLLAPEMDVVARFQGGPNAGHTLIIAGHSTVLHHIPSGVLHRDTLCVIGNGTVVDPDKLLAEIEMLTEGGVPVRQRLKIADRCQLIMPWHKQLDSAREASKKGTLIGTTGCGIGPAYEDKASRRGIRLADLHSDNIEQTIHDNIEYYNYLLVEYYNSSPVTLEEVNGVVQRTKEELLALTCDATLFMHQHLQAGSSILFEGAQGSMLDIDHGSYPFVTSSNTTAGAALSGLGVGPHTVDQVLGIAKAYTTRVGEGPFPTELYDGEQNLDPDGRQMAEVGKEFGATTGRLRRTGWFDAVVIRHAVRINGITGLAITKMDVLDGMESIKIATRYRLADDQEGEPIDWIPSTAEQYSRCQPLYEVMPGWSESSYGATDITQLPDAAVRFLHRIEELCGVPVVMLSTGPERSHVIRLKPAFFD